MCPQWARSKVLRDATITLITRDAHLVMLDHEHLDVFGLAHLDLLRVLLPLLVADVA